jgi:hypothetical protein
MDEVIGLLGHERGIYRHMNFTHNREMKGNLYHPSTYAYKNEVCEE